MYTMDVTQDTTIKGSVAVNFSASTLNGEGEKALADRDGLMVSAMLVDIALRGLPSPPATPPAPTCPRPPGRGRRLAGRRPGEPGPGEAEHHRRVLQDHHPGLDGPVQPRRRLRLCLRRQRDLPGGGPVLRHTLYLQPNLYEVPVYHTLALVLYAYEPGMASYDQNYTIQVDNASVAAQIPVSDAPTSTIRTYSDVASTDWFYDGVKYVSDREIMTGMDEGIFAPQSNTTRAQLVTMLYRLAAPPTCRRRARTIPSPTWMPAAGMARRCTGPGPTASSPAPVTPPSPPTAR